MEIKFTGKRALVTGASRGIGHGILIGLASGGAEVIGLATNIDPILALQKQHPEWKISAVACDLRNWETTRKCVEEMGDIDLLVNNAAILERETFLNVKPESFDDIFNVNVKAVVNVSQIVIKTMIERKVRGSIVNVSSFVSQRGVPIIGLYAASKAALDFFTRSMAVEFGSQGIRINSVNPTVVPTDMGRRQIPNAELTEIWKSKNPLNSLAEISDVVSAVLFLLSDQAAMTTGTSLPIEGGILVM